MLQRYAAWNTDAGARDAHCRLSAGDRLEWTATTSTRPQRLRSPCASSAEEWDDVPGWSPLPDDVAFGCRCGHRGFPASTLIAELWPYGATGRHGSWPRKVERLRGSPEVAAGAYSERGMPRRLSISPLCHGQRGIPHQRRDVHPVLYRDTGRPSGATRPPLPTQGNGGRAREYLQTLRRIGRILRREGFPVDSRSHRLNPRPAGPPSWRRGARARVLGRMRWGLALSRRVPGYAALVVLLRPRRRPGCRPQNLCPLSSHGAVSRVRHADRIDPPSWLLGKHQSERPARTACRVTSATQLAGCKGIRRGVSWPLG